MGRITLVCTDHVENGQCNETELLRILEMINPDVIFEEIRSSDFDAIYSDSSKHTLEMRAISKYLKIRPAKQVPVDAYEISENFKRDMPFVERYVKSNSHEYCMVMNEIYQMMFDFGFKYLNSPQLISQIKNSEEIFGKVLSKCGDNYLMELHAMWNEQVRRREKSMLENIYLFCRNNSFKEGVFLVGAAHMAPIIEGIESRMKNEANLVDWKIWNRL